MLHLEQELLHLAEADQHVAEGELLIGNLKASIERGRAAGRNVFESEETLASMRAWLTTLVDHRELIRSSVKAIKDGR